MTAKIIQFAERSPKKINQKYFDAFFGQLLKFGAERATDEQVSGDASAKAKHLKRVDATAPVDSGLGCDSRAKTSAPIQSGWVGEDGAFIPEDEKEKAQ